MKKLLFLFSALLLISCDSRISTSELEIEVKESIIETLSENSESEGIEVIGFNLVQSIMT